MATIRGTSRNDVLNGGIEDDLIQGLGGNDVLNGAAGNDRLEGGAGADRLDGGIGADTMLGGGGNDIYVVDNAGDIVQEAASQGTDTVESYISYTLTTDVENLTLMGTAANATGNSRANTLTGNSVDNVLNGLGGNDTMRGGLGNDTYYVNTAGDVVSEAAAQGGDKVVSSINYTLGANVEFLELSGSALVGRGNELGNQIYGNAGNNQLYGGAGNDLLRGRGGIDYMEGGTGDDIYLIEDLGEQIVEGLNEGYDTVSSSVSYTLSANLDRLDLTGQAFAGRGNALDNLMFGNAIANVLDAGDGNDTVYGNDGGDELHGDGGNDRLSGGLGDDQIYGDAGDDVISGDAGNDYIDGGLGQDTLHGWSGDDTYFIGNGENDTIHERVNDGIDTVRTTNSSLTLAANVENYVWVGSGAATGIGNDLANHMSGASEMHGLGGNDILVGGNAFNYLHGDAGDDVIQGGAVGDSLLGGDGDDLVLGAGGRDTLSGNDGNDVLDGGIDNDYYLGGLGDDRFIVDSGNETIWEYEGEGVDTVESSVDIQWLANNVENLDLTGTAWVGHGNNSDNSIRGGRELWGEGGDDTLEGGTQNDELHGGAGDDTYYVDSDTDWVFEDYFDGIDTVISTTYYSYRLSDHVENLEMRGGGTGYGNDLNNTMRGGTLWGEGGDDTLYGDDDRNMYWGGTGNDSMYGEGNDDLLEGMEGDDLLIGGAGSDYLQGQEGADILEGGAGMNTLIGGMDIDRFVFEHAEGSGEYDSVLFADLGASGDLWDFSRLDWVNGGAADAEHFRLTYGYDQYGWVYTSIAVDLDGFGRDHEYYEVARANYVEMTYDDLANFIV